MATGDSADTEATLARHVEGVISGDVEAVMKNFTEDSVVFTPDVTACGLAAIRSDTEAFFKNTPPELLQAIEVVRQDIVGEVAYLLWKAEPFVALATETYVVRNGKIMAQTFAVLGGGEPAA
jgi:ketosteroid isomerase-like protein